MAPKKRAGGGKKSFLKGVSRGELDEIDANLAPSEEPQQQCTGEEATLDSIAQPVGLTGISAANTSAAISQTLNTAVGGAGATGEIDECLGVKITEIDGHSGGEETRGQMLQRHKKVRLNQATSGTLDCKYSQVGFNTTNAGNSPGHSIYRECCCMRMYAVEVYMSELVSRNFCMKFTQQSQKLMYFRAMTIHASTAVVNGRHTVEQIFSAILCNGRK